jgi:hypothetical protein
MCGTLDCPSTVRPLDRYADAASGGGRPVRDGRTGWRRQNDIILFIPIELKFHVHVAWGGDFITS